MVESICDCTSKPEGESHPGSSNTERYSPVVDEEAQVHLESDKEEEEDETHVGSGGECSHGGGREDSIGEAWGTTEDRWT